MLDRQKLSAARLYAASHLPYLAAALFAVPVIESEGSGTLGIDGQWRIHADPDAVAVLEPSELGRVLLHLVSHVLREHGARAERLGIDSSTGERWLLAADAEVNDDLAAVDVLARLAPDVPSDFGEPPTEVAETYFDRLGAHEGAARRGSLDCGAGADGLGRPNDEEGDEPGLAELRQRLVQMAVAGDIASEEEREPGTVPAGWRRWADNLLEPAVDWRRELAAHLRRAIARVAGSVDYTYRRPSRRASISTDVILPALEQPVPEVAVVCDTSGSMTEDLLARALTELDGICRSVGLNRQIRVLACDAAVHSVERISRVSELTLAGGGGTNMGAGIAAALELRPRPSVVVVLTDGLTPWPDAAPVVPTIVGLLMPRRGMQRSAPAWASVVVIDDGARP